MTQPGQIYRWLDAAVAGGGGARSLYAPDTTLSRRGLKTRADRRAHELIGLGVGPGDLVALCMGNVAELHVLLLACSGLGAAAVLVDPANGDGALQRVVARLPVRVVVRRPKGETERVDYGPIAVSSRRRLSSSLLMIERLDRPADPELTRGAEVVLTTVAPGGGEVDIFRDGQTLGRMGEAVARLLELDAETRVLCAQPFTSPRFFDPAVLGWLCSEAQLVMAEGDAPSQVIAMAGSAERLVLIDTIGRIGTLARERGGSLPRIRAVTPQATIDASYARGWDRAFGEPVHQLLLLEELGVLGSRVMLRDERFRPAPGVGFAQGGPMAAGGHELLVVTDQHGGVRPEPTGSAPGAPDCDDPDLARTGYACRFDRDGAVLDVLGRDDGLVNLEGRRGCMDHVEMALLTHRRMSWVRALPQRGADGDDQIVVEYVATGDTTVDDLEEHAVAMLPPYEVPRRFIRLAAPPTES
jgi:acyl-CoA synthetase (AMP-forming)/AMP-acid ligase II